MALDLAQFHDAFFDESFEALDTMEAALLKLNVGAPEPEVVNTIFRVAHSIKGGSATFGFAEVASFTHTCETLLDELRGNRMQVSRYITDLLLKSVDIMREMLRAVQHKSPVDAQRVADVQFDLELAIVQKSAPAPVAIAPPPPTEVVDATPARQRGAHRWRIQFRPYPQLFAHGNDPLRMLRELADLGDLEVEVATKNLPGLRELDPESCYLSWELTVTTDATREVIDQVFDWAEGDCELHIRDESAATTVASPKLAVVAEVKAPDAPRLVALDTGDMPKQGLVDGGSIRVSTEKVDELMNTVGELVITQSMLTQLGEKIGGNLATQLRAGLSQLERNVRELQESVMRVRMLPISFVFSRFPRMVRDLSGRLGKQVELKVIGDQTELDKTVLEKIGDPMVHLVRNSVDHGIEMPHARVAAGKPSTGVISLEAYHKGGNIVVEVGDDGGGLQRERILAKARERGLVGANDELDDAQVRDLIFMPGFSTADQATDISGRGVGMDVVRRNIKELGGSIEVRSTAGCRLALHHHAAADARHRRRAIGVCRQRDLHRAADHHHRIAPAAARRGESRRRSSGSVLVPRRLRADRAAA